MILASQLSWGMILIFFVVLIKEKNILDKFKYNISIFLYFLDHLFKIFLILIYLQLIVMTTKQVVAIPLDYQKAKVPEPVNDIEKIALNFGFTLSAG